MSGLPSPLMSPAPMPCARGCPPRRPASRAMAVWVGRIRLGPAHRAPPGRPGRLAVAVESFITVTSATVGPGGMTFLNASQRRGSPLRIDVEDRSPYVEASRTSGQPSPVKSPANSSQSRGERRLAAVAAQNSRFLVNSGPKKMNGPDTTSMLPSQSNVSGSGERVVERREPHHPEVRRQLFFGAIRLTLGRRTTRLGSAPHRSSGEQGDRSEAAELLVGGAAGAGRVAAALVHPHPQDVGVDHDVEIVPVVGLERLGGARVRPPGRPGRRRVLRRPRARPRARRGPPRRRGRRPAPPRVGATRSTRLRGPKPFARQLPCRSLEWSRAKGGLLTLVERDVNALHARRPASFSAAERRAGT